MKASSTTSVRPGRAKPASTPAGWRTEVGLVGLPTTTRSASSGTAAGSSRKPSRASSSTRVTSCPASRSAASGSVNCGCTTTGRRARTARAISTNASAAPEVSNTRSTGRPCRAATARRAARPSGYAARPSSDAAIRALSQAGGVPLRTFTARSVRSVNAPSAPRTSASPWCRRSGSCGGASSAASRGGADPVCAGMLTAPRCPWTGERSAAVRRPSPGRPPPPPGHRTAHRSAADRPPPSRGNAP